MYSHEDVKELSDRFEKHRDTLEEELKQEPSDDEKRDALEDAEGAIESIAPLLTVDDEELVKHEAALDELREAEQSLAAILEK